MKVLAVAPFKQIVYCVFATGVLAFGIMLVMIERFSRNICANTVAHVVWKSRSYCVSDRELLGWNVAYYSFCASAGSLVVMILAAYLWRELTEFRQHNTH